MKHIRYWLALGTLALSTFSSVAAAQTSAKVTGEVLYRERIALPTSAIVTVRLEDVSLADAPAVVIAEQRIEPMGKGPPYPFELAYDLAKIDERFNYAVRAEITDGDKLLFTTTERYPVITQGNPTSGIQIVVKSVAAAPAPQPHCFSETGHCVGGRFLEYWQQNGGLAVFGYPISDEMTENGYTVQYFERQRFELHPENARPYDVLLGRLGDELLRRSGVDWQTQPKVAGPQPGCRFFPETGHNVCNVMGGPAFLTYWSTHGLEFDELRGKSYAESLALFGLPLTAPQQETNASGDTVLTQWFERARFEYHPNNPAAYRVLLGRLGAEVMGTVPSAGIVGTTWQLE
ncbi:MAG TPA: YbaY family lipoprotein, partial [Roseiflexaceae bacterium]|nr:YbaY family lipoprotein [Roseiflexaceae bacterium]